MKQMIAQAARLSGANPLYLAIGLPMLLGVVVLLTNGMVPFANNGHCDPWHYFGYFYLDDQFAAVGDSRTYSRLPSTILGFGLTKVFHSVLADYLQYLILLVLTTGTVFLFAQRLFGTFAAVVSATFLATSGIVIGVLSVNYTGPSLAWSTLATGCALGAGFADDDRRRRLLLIAAGFFLATAIIGHLYSLTYNFVVPLYAINWSSATRKRVLAQQPRIVGHLLVGVILAILVLGLVSKFLLNAEFTFFRHQFLEVFTVKVTEYRKPLWYLSGGKLALVALGVGLAGAGLILRRWFADAGKSLAVNVPLAVLLTAQLLYTALGGITLQYDYYYVWVLPPIALSMAGLVSLVAPKGRTAFICGTVFVVLSLWATTFGYAPIVDVTRAWPSLVVGLVGGGAVCILVLRRARVTLVVALVALAALSTTIRPERMGTQVWSGWGNGSASYERLRQGWEFLAQFHFQERPLFWLAAKDGDMSETVAFPRGFEYCHIDTALPGFVPPDDDNYDAKAEAFAPGRLLVAATPDQPTFTTALAALKTKHALRFEELARQSVSGRGVTYILVIGRLQPAAPG